MMRSIFGQHELAEKLNRVSYVLDRQEDWCRITTNILDFDLISVLHGFMAEFSDFF